MQDFYPGDIHELFKWVRSGKWKTEHAPEPYWSWVYERLPVKSNIFHRVGMLNWDSPASDEWCEPYPHVHSESMGWEPEVFTILTYLVAPEEGGEFAMGGLSPDDPYVDIPVKPGVTVGCDSITWHGVRPVKKGTRIALLTVGFPAELQ